MPQLVAKLSSSCLAAMRLAPPSLAKHPQSVPAWLQKLASDKSEGPKLYAWTPDNLEGLQQRSVGDVITRLPGGSESTPGRRIHILGIGNLGRLYAASLASLAEAPVTMVLHRKSLLEQWISDPAIEITRRGLTERVSAFDVEWWTEEKPSVGPIREVCGGTGIRNLIVGTKAPDALPQVDRLRRYLDGSSTVAFVQNGMNRLWPPNGAMYNSRRFPPKQHPNWIVCVTTHGVTSLGAFKSIHASPADVAMGPVLLNPESQSEAAYLIDQILRAPHLSARNVQTSALWVLQLEKLVVNSTINPMTALLRCKNGLLFSRPGSNSERVMDLLLAEASLVLQELVRDNSSREILAAAEASSNGEKAAMANTQSAMLARFSFSQLRAMLRHVGEKVKDNTSSMLQDVTSGKQTEIREFNGWFVEMAEYLGVETPNHRMVCELVEKGSILEENKLGRYFPAEEAANAINKV